MATAKQLHDLYFKDNKADDSKEVNQYKEKIYKLLDSEEKQKSAATILTELINQK